MSADHRWFKFWPQDWQRDPALRSCGVAARGLWMDLLCIMHEGEPYGHLTIGGKNPNARQIGTITGVSEKDAVRLLEELESVGVFSRRSDGVIYSRRMVRDKAASDAGRVSGKRGGNPALKDTNKGPVNGSGGGGGLTPLDNGNGYRPPQTLETEFKSTERKDPHLPSEDVPPTPKRGSRISDSWALTYELRNFALSLSLDAEYEADKFRDHWASKAGKDAVKSDWDRAFKNWCRLGSEFASQRKSKEKPSRNAALLLDTNGNFILPGDLLN